MLSTDTSFTLTATPSSWLETHGTNAGSPLGTSGRFTIVIDKGLATEEKILCASYSGAVVTVFASGSGPTAFSGRGFDGTSAQDHTAPTNPSGLIKPVWVSKYAFEANLLASQLLGDALGAAGTVVTSDGTGLVFGTANFLTPTAQSGAYNAVDGDLVLMTGAHTTTLPTPTAGRKVGVVQVTTAAATIAPASGALHGPGISAWATSTGGTGAPLAHAGAFTIWVADGSNWNLVAGAIDTGWVECDSVVNNSFTVETTHVYWRQIGNRVTFNGTIGGNATTGAQVVFSPSGAAAANPPNSVQTYQGIVLAVANSGSPSSGFADAAPGTGGAAISVTYLTGLANVRLDSLSYLVD